jgi:hypothetical protein
MAALDHQGAKVPAQWQIADTELDVCSSGNGSTLVQEDDGRKTCLY